MTNKKQAAPVAGPDASCPDEPGVRTYHRWNTLRRSLFLDELAKSVNVTQSAARAGMSTSAAYKYRNNNPEFARAWAAALEVGYCELEMALLQRAMHGDTRTTTFCEGEDGQIRYTKRVHGYSNTVGMRLLAAHRSGALAYRGAEPAEDPQATHKSRLERASAFLERLRAQILAREEEA